MRPEVSEEELNLVFTSFTTAGIALTVATLQWSIAFLAKRPDIQAEAFQAIQQHYGTTTKHHGDLDDDQGCAYIVSLIRECLRYFTPARCALPRSTVKDFSYANKTVPAGTTVFLNAGACNIDPKIHTSPTSFNPTRFLPPPPPISTPPSTLSSPPTTALWTPPPIFTYGLGSRPCTGTVLANRLLYLFFIRLISAFEILPYDNANTDPVSGCADSRSIISSPRRYKVVFKARNAVALADALGEKS